MILQEILQVALDDCLIAVNKDQTYIETFTNRDKNKCKQYARATVNSIMAMEDEVIAININVD